MTYFEQLDKNPHSHRRRAGPRRAAGQHPEHDRQPGHVIDPAQLPVDPATCQPVYPHQYLKVNTIFEVARAAGLRPPGPTSTRPTRSSTALPAPASRTSSPRRSTATPRTLGDRDDWTTDNALTKQYDSYKVQAMINEINGFDHSGTTCVGTPAIFGMNFQTVSTAQKLPDLRRAHRRLPRRRHHTRSAAAGARLHQRHDRRDGRRRSRTPPGPQHGDHPFGQARPVAADPSALTRIPDGPIIAALNAAWEAAHPTDTQPLVAFSVDDDGMLMWLNDRSQAAAEFAKDFLLAPSGTGNDINGNPKPYTRSGLARSSPVSAAAYFKVQPGRSPGSRRVRHRPVRHRLHRRQGQDRRARRRQPAGPRRPPGRLGRPDQATRGDRRPGRDDPDRADHPQAARPRPEGLEAVQIEHTAVLPRT